MVDIRNLKAVSLIFGALLSFNIKANYPLPPDAPRPEPKGAFLIQNIQGFEGLDGKILSVERAAYFDDLTYNVRDKKDDRAEFYFSIPLSRKGYKGHDTSYNTRDLLRFHAFRDAGETYRLWSFGNFAMPIRTGTYADYSNVETLVTKLRDRDDTQVLLTVRDYKSKTEIRKALLTAQKGTKGFFKIIKDEKKTPWNHGFWDWQKKSK